MNDYGAGERYPDEFGDRDDWYEMARARVRTPGTILQWFGLISVFLTVISLAVMLINPDAMFRWQYDFQADLNAKQPPENRQPMPPYEEFVKSQTMINVPAGILQLIGSVIIFYGGSQMKQLRGYGWAIAASVLSIIPCNCCCCLGAPFGIWSLAVLMNSDVKLAFSRAAGAGMAGAE